ncbi:uncharacterized protein VTP21DRAFT_1364 [Calcarisporiella thermophila]|uniref:uncharacterized protein n=1 Tax=Calcarisporiella thermophila TaxID=911321 RepID=UPI0037444F94
MVSPKLRISPKSKFIYKGVRKNSKSRSVRKISRQQQQSIHGHSSVDSTTDSWLTMLINAFEHDFDRTLTYRELELKRYLLDQYPRLRSERSETVQERMRETLQQYDCFSNVSRGTWTFLPHKKPSADFITGSVKIREEITEKSWYLDRDEKSKKPELKVEDEEDEDVEISVVDEDDDIATSRKPENPMYSFGGSTTMDNCDKNTAEKASPVHSTIDSGIEDIELDEMIDPVQNTYQNADGEPSTSTLPPKKRFFTFATPPSSGSDSQDNSSPKETPHKPAKRVKTPSYWWMDRSPFEKEDLVADMDDMQCGTPSSSSTEEEDWRELGPQQLNGRRHSVSGPLHDYFHWYQRQRGIKYPTQRSDKSVYIACPMLQTPRLSARRSSVHYPRLSPMAELEEEERERRLAGGGIELEIENAQRSAAETMVYDLQTPRSPSCFSLQSSRSSSVEHLSDTHSTINCSLPSAQHSQSIGRSEQDAIAALALLGNKGDDLGGPF